MLENESICIQLSTQLIGDRIKNSRVHWFCDSHRPIASNESTIKTRQVIHSTCLPLRLTPPPGGSLQNDEDLTIASITKKNRWQIELHLFVLHEKTLSTRREAFINFQPSSVIMWLRAQNARQHCEWIFKSSSHLLVVCGEEILVKLTVFWLSSHGNLLLSLSLDQLLGKWISFRSLNGREVLTIYGVIRTPLTHPTWVLHGRSPLTKRATNPIGYL